MKSVLVGSVLVASALSLVGCDHIPGFGKKDGGDEGGAGSGGGVLSFLGGSFEGEITMLVTNKGQNPSQKGPMTMVFGIKSPKFRLDLTGAAATETAASNPMLGAGAGVIIDPPAKKGYVLMPAQKKAMVIDFEKMKALRASHPGGAGGTPTGKPADPNDVPKIEKTGKKETIAGYSCEDWKITTKTSHADMCVAEGIKWFDLTDLGLATPEVTLAAAVTDLNHFPLRVVSYNAQNVEETRMEAQKIEKKTLDAARFQVPADFQVVDMTAMLGAFPGLGATGTLGGGGAPPGLPPGFKLPPSAKPH